MCTATLPVRAPLVSYLSTITWSRPSLRAAISLSRCTTTSRPQPIPRLGSVHEDIECRVPQATSSVSMARASSAGPEDGGAARTGAASRRTIAKARDGTMGLLSALRGESYCRFSPTQGSRTPRTAGTARTKKPHVLGCIVRVLAVLAVLGVLTRHHGAPSLRNTVARSTAGRAPRPRAAPSRAWPSRRRDRRSGAAGAPARAGPRARRSRRRSGGPRRRPSAADPAPHRHLRWRRGRAPRPWPRRGGGRDPPPPRRAPPPARPRRGPDPAGRRRGAPGPAA